MLVQEGVVLEGHGLVGSVGCGLVCSGGCGLVGSEGVVLKGVVFLVQVGLGG